MEKEIKVERVPISEKVRFELGKDSIEIIVDDNGSIEWYNSELSSNLDRFADIQEIASLSDEEFENCVKLFRRVREFDKTNE